MTWCRKANNKILKDETRSLAHTQNAKLAPLALMLVSYRQPANRIQSGDSMTDRPYLSAMMGAVPIKSPFSFRGKPAIRMR